jgi:mono/diheme cytochrome c family protein
MLRRSAGPAPPEVAADPLLSQGRLIFLARCIPCHGSDGRGDGPLAANLFGPPPGDLADDEWKHGDRPEQVLAVIRDGVPNTRMQGWGTVLDPPEIQAAAAYVYYLAHRVVPSELRKDRPAQAP